MVRRSLGSILDIRSALSGALAGLLVLISPSCGSWSGNPPSSKVDVGTTAPVEKQGTVTIVVQGSGAALRLLNKNIPVRDKAGKPAGQVTLSSVQLVLSDIMVRQDTSDVTARPKLSGPFVVDLLNDTISPQPEKLVLPEGDYKNISLHLYKKAGGSVQLSGTYSAPNQKDAAIQIALDAEDEIALMQAAAATIIHVRSGSDEAIAVTFQVDQWFNFTGKDTDLASAGGKDITLDATATGEARRLHDAVLSNVKAAADFDKYKGTSDNKDGSGNNHNGNGDRRNGGRY